MMAEERDGFEEVKEIAKMMKAEGIIKLQTSNCSIEIHPAYLGRTEQNEVVEQKEKPVELTPEERIRRARQALGEMMGGI